LQDQPGDAWVFGTTLRTTSEKFRSPDENARLLG
jgi:hypothetical protein